MTYQIRKELEQPYTEVLAKVQAALKSEGFGVLTEIDIQDTLKKKLDVDFRRYKIIGACNPPLAFRALQTELELGLFLPCNLIVYESDAGGTVVAAIDPSATMGNIGNPALVPLAAAVREKLVRVLDNLD